MRPPPDSGSATIRGPRALWWAVVGGLLIRFANQQWQRSWLWGGSATIRGPRALWWAVVGGLLIRFANQRWQRSWLWSVAGMC